LNTQKLNELEKSIQSLKEENSNLIKQLIQTDNLNKLQLKKANEELQILKVEVFS